jgi:uncharacterized protein (DUF2147 family)
MRHRVVAPALSVLAAGLFATVSPSLASAADPSGIWVRDDGSAKVEIKKCGRGICSKVVWLRNPEDSRGKPLHDARNEDPSKRGRPIIGLPLFTNMPPAGPNTWVGNVYNPEEGHIYTNVRVTLVSRQQIVLRGCKTWLLCGEKMWTRSHLPAIPAPEKLIEVEATGEPGSIDKSEPRSAPKPEAPMVEAFREREPLSAPGFTLAKTDARWDLRPLSGTNVPSMIVMTSPSSMATMNEPRPTEVATAQEQDLLIPVRFPAPRPKAQGAAQAQAASAAPGLVEPKPNPAVRETQEEWPWLKRRSARFVFTRTGAQQQRPWLKRRSARLVSARAAPRLVEPKPKRVVREAQEQWPWLQRRSALLVATRTGDW